MRLRFEAVSFQYPSGVQALDQIDLDIASGSCMAIIGENGAGKTTLVKQLNGLLRPTSGKVWVGDWDTAEHSTAQLAARVGFLFQNPDEQLFERTVRREVAFGPRNLNLGADEIDQRVESALQTAGLADVADRHPYDLQYNQRKLVALAATLAMRTPALVLDEPTIGQDTAQRQRIGAVVEGLKREGRTQVLITHDLDFCAEHAERVIVMADGRILDDGDPTAVLARGDTLARAAVTAPQVVRLAQALALPGTPLTVDEFVAAYAATKKG